jgi:3-oxoacyl-[acyl-carrier-protein] synthase-3
VTGVIRASHGAAYSKLLGVGAYRPPRVVTNEEICTWLDSSDEWIRERSGIIERRWAGPEESVVSMAVAASEKALAQSGIAADQIGAIVLGTVTHPFQTPSAAAEVADLIGAKNAGAFDTSAACAGFSYGIAIADGLIRTGTAEYVLNIGVEKLTDFVDKADRGTGFIFADGAGAVVVGPSTEPCIGPTIWGADGSQRDVIIAEPDWVTLREQGGDWPVLKMQGQRVFRWAVGEMAAVCKQALDAAGVAPEDLDVFIPHQANMRITDAMVRTLHLPENVVIARDIAVQGNTSAASIPLAMDRLYENGEIHSGQTALLVGFGAGLVYASQVVTIP